MTHKVYDFIAIGIGPFNLSLACLTDHLTELDGLFFDQRAGFDWHPGLMIEGVHLQTPFMSDLVTLADPTHPLSFLNYTKQQGKLYSFYIREDFFLLRQEYNQYCQWAVEQLSNLRWHKRVDRSRYLTEKCCYELVVTDTRTQQQETYFAKKLVLGTGPAPYWPPCCDKAVEEYESCIHSGDYLYKKAKLQQQSNITVLGSGQSAAEIFYDLLQDIDQYDYTLNWVTSAPRFYPLEYSKLTLEMTSPEYVDYFYGLPAGERKALVAKQKNLYKGINSDLINEIFDLLYSKRVKLGSNSANLKVNILTNSRLQTVEHIAGRPQSPLQLGFYHTEQNKAFSLSSESLILATGYQYREPEFLLPLKQHIRYDKDGQFHVNRNYSIDHQGKEIFVQNAELHTHGFVSPDLGMACYRNSYIIKELTGKTIYPIEERIAFQTFGVPESGDQMIAASTEKLVNESA